jgi:hypothetical protein
MIIDAENMFSDAQAVTSTAKSTNTVDLGPNSHAKNSNGAKDIEILLWINTTFTDSGSDATLTIQVRSSANSDMSSPVVHSVSDTIAFSEMVAGTKMRFKPRIPLDAGRYIDLNYVVASGPYTAGALSAGVVAERQTNQ